MLDTSDPRIERLCARLAPYARGLLERAGLHALRLHADCVTVEHLLSILMGDDRSGAHAVVLHAFADPDTIAAEALAISPGVMVVASVSTLPFSPLGLGALRHARGLAVGRGAAEVDERDLLEGAIRALPAEAVRALETAGWRAAALGRAPAAGGSAAPIDAAGPLFRHFSMQAKRALAAANRSAAQSGQDAITPAHVVIGCLRGEERLAELAGLTGQRARLALSAHLADETPLEPRRLPADDALAGFLGRLPEGATSVALLAEMLASGPPELAGILVRHKVTELLLERARTVFGDPDPAS